MITLYELHWSHYCEKIRLALDYMGLTWRMQEINGFTKSDFQTHSKPAHLPNYTVPAIWDDNTRIFVMDSTDIVRYLAKTYPHAPTLLPGNAENQAAIETMLIELDSELGLAARRFGYTQVILECPDLLADLFTRQIARGFFTLPLIRHATGFFLSMVLTQRFDFHLAEQLGLYEALEHYLVQLARRLDANDFVVGKAFSIADLALAAQLRPVSIVPFFREHPKLQSLWHRQAAVIAQYGQREPELIYQSEIVKRRLSKAPWRRRIRETRALVPSLVLGERCSASTLDITKAMNDQKPIWNWRMWTMPWHVLVTLKVGRSRSMLVRPGIR